MRFCLLFDGSPGLASGAKNLSLISRNLVFKVCSDFRRRPISFATVSMGLALGVCS